MMYLLDTNVFLEAKNRYYRFELCPGFLDFLSKQETKNYILSIKGVYDKIISDDDEMSILAKKHKNFFIDTDDSETRLIYGKIINYVINHPTF